MNIRIGPGYDVHRLEKGRKLIIGGVDIPHETGLSGHSDADVLTHALMDAILGALCMGDIGKLFPDTDDKYLGADSLLLLKEVFNVMKQKGFCLSNADCTIVAQAPKLSPYIPEMREKIANVLGVTADCINIKATTEEKLGFTGAREGIAAHAVCLIQK